MNAVTLHVTLNGVEQRDWTIRGEYTIEILKYELNDRFPGFTSVTMTLNNGEILSPEVWETNQYDHITFTHYYNNGLLDGSIIDITTNPVVQPVNPEENIQPAVAPTEKRRELIDRVARYTTTLRRVDFERIVSPPTEYEEFVREFPTLDIYKQKQRQYLEEATIEDLRFYLTLIEKLGGDIKYMDMEDAAPGQRPEFFFLMPGNKIVLVAER